MRARVNLIIEEALLAKIDRIAGDKNKRAATIEIALREFIEREEAKEETVSQTEVPNEKNSLASNQAKV